VLTITGLTITGGRMNQPKKSLGQHWLHNAEALAAVADAADIGAEDVVLEVGPGLGTLTEVLTSRAHQVIAVELDEKLAADLEKSAAANLLIVKDDILKFDLSGLPADYKVVANIPYYLTSNLLRVLSESVNPPAAMSLLVQKEVAERIAAKPGQMSLLSVSVQMYYKPELARVVEAELFTPPPKVDSQIIALTRYDNPLLEGIDIKLFFRVVKAGFSERRKKLRSSLAAGLQIEKAGADEILSAAGVDGDKRAQELSLEDWHRIYNCVTSLL